MNPKKYIGDPTDIFFRSSLEKRFCIYADSNPKILKWGCECIAIPYSLKSLKDDSVTHHTYYPDFMIDVDRPDLPTLMKRYLIEVKPFAEVKRPVLPKNASSLKKLKSLEYQIVTYNKNVFKWLQAIDWCKARDIEFKLVVEENFEKTLRYISKWDG